MNGLSRCANDQIFINKYYSELINEINVYTEELIKSHQNEAEGTTIRQSTQRHTNNNQNDAKTKRRALRNDVSRYYKYTNNSSGREVQCQQPLCAAAAKANEPLEDYANAMRMQAIDALKKVRDLTLERERMRAIRINLSTGHDDEKARSVLFASKFCFIMSIEKVYPVVEGHCYPIVLHNSAKFKMYTVACDFYMSKNQIKLISGLLQSRKETVKTYENAAIDKQTFVSYLVSHYIRGHLLRSDFANNIIEVNIKSLLSASQAYLDDGFNGGLLVERDSFFDFSNMTCLKISKSGFSTKAVNFKLSLNAFYNLERLKIDIEYSNIVVREIISPSIPNLEKMREFSFRGVFKSIDDGLYLWFHMLKLETLELNVLSKYTYPTKNSVQSYPDFAALKCLKKLKLNGEFLLHNKNQNLLRTLPIELVCLELDCLLDYARLDKLLSKVSLPYLKTFKLRIKCEMENFAFRHEWFSGLRELEELELKSLDRSGLNVLDFDCGPHLPKLKSLDLSNNRIYRITQMKGLANLTTLNLTNNLLLSIHSDISKNMPSLEILLLGKNEIQCVNRFKLNGLKNLRFLSLNQNYSNLKIHEKAFSDLRHLKTLFLNLNHLENFNVKWFDDMQLDYLDLGNNSFSNLENLNFLIDLDKVTKKVNLKCVFEENLSIKPKSIKKFIDSNSLKIQVFVESHFM